MAMNQNQQPQQGSDKSTRQNRPGQASETERGSQSESSSTGTGNKNAMNDSDKKLSQNTRPDTDKAGFKAAEDTEKDLDSESQNDRDTDEDLDQSSNH